MNTSDDGTEAGYRLTGPVVTVTPNPAVDLTYSVDGITAGHTHRMPPPLSRAGGKGLNVARVIHAAGYPTLAIATAGAGTGAEFSAELQSSGVPHELVPVAAPTRRSLAFVDTADNETSIFNEQGGRLSPSEWSALDALIADKLAGAGCLVGSGSLPEDAPADFYPRLVAKAAEFKVPCIIDTSGSALLKAADAGADVLKPNHHELMGATGIGTLDAAAANLLDRGVRLLFVSCGADGLRAYSADDRSRAWHARLPEPLTGNPTGAGDAAVAAIAVVLAAGVTDPRAMLTLAASWSAAAVLMPAAGEIHHSHADLTACLELTSVPTRQPTEMDHAS
ncbi:hexose kinase [Arthrobacter sp. H5]|uniref:1-phosphofructokinase family hexose kinase n=1 Tax=Arthrobacter sp. H5 TaxID=1267973 RepID=UPI0004ACBBB5|nr:hexose kinase [Arthrobacter sp. H5]